MVKRIFALTMGMTASAPTPILPEAILVGALSAQLRHTQSDLQMSGLRRLQAIRFAKNNGSSQMGAEPAKSTEGDLQGQSYALGARRVGGASIRA